MYPSVFDGLALTNFGWTDRAFLVHESKSLKAPALDAAKVFAPVHTGRQYARMEV
jgi:hypothetical protein